MARAALAELGPVPALAVLPGGASGSQVQGLPRRSVLRASHPEPDASSVRAARRALSFFARFGAEDAILCLISGGTSSLVALPRPGIPLERKRRAVAALAASGATIAEVNRLRTAGVTFRSDPVTGPGGKQVLAVDPSGNLVELFQSSRSADSR